MKKERLFPFWTDLERVIAVAQSDIANGLKLTVVSMESYTRYGFLLTMNVEATTPNGVFDRNGRGWMRATISDQGGNHYTSHLAMIGGVFF